MLGRGEHKRRRRCKDHTRAQYHTSHAIRSPRTAHRMLYASSVPRIACYTFPHIACYTPAQYRASHTITARSGLRLLSSALTARCGIKDIPPTL
eukprot:3382733-Rhodomonas_salina.1